MPTQSAKFPFMVAGVYVMRGISPLTLSSLDQPLISLFKPSIGNHCGRSGTGSASTELHEGQTRKSNPRSSAFVPWGTLGGPDSAHEKREVEACRLPCLISN